MLALVSITQLMFMWPLEVKPLNNKCSNIKNQGKKTTRNWEKERLKTSMVETIQQMQVGKSILGWYHWKLLLKMVNEPKITKSFSWALYFKCFHNYELLIFHVYQLHALIYGLKFIFEVKNWKLLKFVFLIKMALSKIDNFNFGNS